MTGTDTVPIRTEIRIQWVDIAKGITIILMIIGHTGIPRSISNWIFSFHMPLFFIMSGLTTNWGKDSFSSFVMRRVRRILYPFIWYSLIMLGLLRLFGLDHTQCSVLSGWGGYALWFVPVLFMGQLISGFFLIVLNIRKDVILLLLMIFLSFVSCTLCYYGIRSTI